MTVNSKPVAPVGSIARRHFLAAIPAAVASLAAGAAQKQPPRVDKATLDCAEKVMGVEFTDAEVEAAAAGVSRNLDAFERLRKLSIPLDTEPAIGFRPYLPGQRSTGPATPGAHIRITSSTRVARPGSVDELAFLPITALAPLIERRDVSVTELTNMYLARLRKYGPKLNRS
jgi:hypothetical protein